MRELATLSMEGETIRLDLPLRVPALALRLRGQRARGVAVDEVPLRQAHDRRAFQSGTFCHEGADTLLAFDRPPEQRAVSVRIHAG